MTAERRFRRIIVYSAASMLGVALFLFLFWSLRSLLLPIIIGALLAYLFKPLLNSFRYTWVPESLRVLLILSMIGYGIFSIYSSIKSNIPSEREQIELMVRIQYKLNQKYQSAMSIDKETGKGNFIYNMTHQETAPLLEHLNTWLSLNTKQQIQFNDHYKNSLVENDKKYYQYFILNKKNYYKHIATHSATLKSKKITTETAGEDESSFLGKLLNTLSTWLVLPFVFIFLLFDNGQILKYLVRMIPNKYFELSLTIIDEVDTALGKYLRGTLLECSLVGVTLAFGLMLIGLDTQVSMIIGLVAGIANAIPFLGPVIGLVVGLCYALIAENISPILPFINEGNVVLGVLLTVAVAQVMDNIVYQPIVLGSAVNLHPLVVIIGVMGGSIIFGFSGMLLAIPTIVIFKVVIETLFKELKAYRII